MNGQQGCLHGCLVPAIPASTGCTVWSLLPSFDVVVRRSRTTVGECDKGADNKP
jgi:hypothetical protein